MTPQKRKVPLFDPDSQAKKPKRAEFTAKSKVPVFSGFGRLIPDNLFVVSDEEGAYDASLSIVNVENNVNKVFNIQLVTDGSGQYWVLRKSGRRGEALVPKMPGQFSMISEAKEVYENLFQKKTGRLWVNRHNSPLPDKYTFNETNPEYMMPLPRETTKLMEIIFKEKYFDIVLDEFDVASQAFLASLDQKAIALGQRYLSRLKFLLQESTRFTFVSPSSYLRKGSTSEIAFRHGQIQQEIEQTTNLYYSAIPRSSGRQPLPMLNDSSRLDGELALIGKLCHADYSGEAVREGHGKYMANYAQFRVNALNAVIDPLNPTSQEFLFLEKYLTKTSADNHGLSFDVQHIFRIERHDEKNRLQSNPERRLLLWHGSPATNFAGILSQGLRITPRGAPFHGSNYGKGIYFADMASKSANYCFMPWDPTSGNDALLLLCEVEVGFSTHNMTSGSPTAEQDCKAAGCIATKGVGQVFPAHWRYGGHIHNSLKRVELPDTSKQFKTRKKEFLNYNEYVVYNESQVKIRYLVYTKVTWH